MSVRRTVVFLVALGACKGRGASADGDSGLDTADSGTVMRDASQALVNDAQPPDDTILPAQSEELATRARHLLEAIAKKRVEKSPVGGPGPGAA